MPEAVVHVLLFIGGGIFSLGVSWANVKRMRKDIDGIGRKVNEGEKIAARRYHNCSLAIIQAAPEKKENEISQLLKEECNQ